MTLFPRVIFPFFFLGCFLIESARAEAPEQIVARLLPLTHQKEGSRDIYIQLGDAYLSMGELDRAKQAFDRALRMGDKVRGHIGIGRVCAQRPGEGIRAQYHFRRALGEDPTSADAYFELAKLYRRMRPLEASDAFERAIERDSSHRDAYFQMGLMLEGDGELVRAMSLYKQQLDIASDHGEARYHLGRLLFAQGQHRSAAELFSGLIASGGDLATRAYLEMALMSEIAKNYESAQQLFEVYISRLHEADRLIYKDISLVAEKEELALLASVPLADRAEAIDRFWNSRDPAPLTRANERLVEHYRRVARVLEKYSEGEKPWDDRGAVYIRLGPPDHISRSDDIRLELDPSILAARERFATRLGPGYVPPAGHPLIPIGGRWEYWVYADIEDGTEFAFENEFGKRYTFADIVLSSESTGISPLLDLQGDLLMRSIAARTPSLYRADFAKLPIDFYYYPAGFRGEDDKTRLELYLGLPASEVVRLNGESGLVSLDRGAVLYDATWHEVHRVVDRLTFRAPSLDDVEAGAFIPGILTVTLDPGEYHLSLQLRDVESGDSQIYQQKIKLDDYRRDEVLRLSDIELAFMIAPTELSGQFVKDGFSVIPMSSKAFRRNQSAYVYFELYNLARDPFGRTRYKVEYTVRTNQARVVPVRILRSLGQLLRLVEEDRQVVITYEQVGDKSDEQAYVELDLRKSDPGEQVIAIRVTDELTHQEAQKEIRFKIVP
ncbi:MAG: GWxTD domain-containing protein [bacterium]|nr:GWxTD domain-containing protein [bacterium]